MAVARWVVTIVVGHGRSPGMLARIARIFADRGISLSDLLATEHGGRAVVLLSFVATERLRDALVRRVARADGVVSVSFREAEESAKLWEYLEPV